jgi:hypothetical protein
VYSVVGHTVAFLPPFCGWIKLALSSPGPGPGAAELGVTGDRGSAGTLRARSNSIGGIPYAAVSLVLACPWPLPFFFSFSILSARGIMLLPTQLASTSLPSLLTTTVFAQVSLSSRV